MPIATANNLSKSFGGETIFRGVSFEIQERDRVALVGANGAGKTTLLRILAGKERPDSGGVAFTSGTRLGYLSQEVTFPPGVTLRQHILTAFKALLDLESQLEAVQEKLAALGGKHDPEVDALLAQHDRLLHQYEVGGGYTYQNRMREVLAGLGIEESRLDQPLETFSGGQRTRVALAELLLSSRDLLLLDEPTNHLDLDATEWLEEFLTQAPQAVVIISHDRWFLDKVAKRTWEMAFGKLERYNGNYTQYAAQRPVRRPARGALRAPAEGIRGTTAPHRQDRGVHRPLPRRAAGPAGTRAPEAAGPAGARGAPPREWRDGDGREVHAALGRDSTGDGSAHGGGRHAAP